MKLVSQGEVSQSKYNISHEINAVASYTDYRILLQILMNGELLIALRSPKLNVLLTSIPVRAATAV